MNYESLYKDFKMLFADELTRINQLESINGIDSTDGIHVAFGMVVVPFVADLINNGHLSDVYKAFQFFEDMCKSENTLICEVLEFTVLEGFISLGSAFLSKCKTYMGSETLESCSAVEKYM